MHFHGTFLQLRRKERFGLVITIDLNSVVTDRSGQDVTDWAKDGQRVFAKQEDGPRAASQHDNWSMV